MRRLLPLCVVAVVLAGPGGAQAPDCVATVVDVRPLAQYDHAAGRGFLAVRSGAGSEHTQIGELYLGDRAEVLDRSGSWIFVSCLEGRCTEPLWGPPYPEGWSFARYLRLEGRCP
jgi:hypothetical protein